MSVSVTMPQLGESVTEGTVTRWLKKEGEHVTADEPLLEVSTDKVDTEIPAPASGILRGIVVDEDETVAVGAQLAMIEDADESAGGGAPAAAPPAPEAAAPSAPAAQPAPEPAAPVPAPRRPTAGYPRRRTPGPGRPRPRSSRPRPRLPATCRRPLPPRPRPQPRPTRRPCP